LSTTAGTSWVPAVAVTGSVVHVAWHDSTAGNWEIYYKRSTDGGSSWGADTRLTNNSASSQLPTLAVSGSIVHIAWMDDSNTYYKRSTNGGSTWGADTRLSMKKNDNDGAPSLAVNGKTVHLVFNGYRLKNGLDIIYRTSTNDGVTWGSDVQLTINSAGANVPSIAVSGSNVHVLFRDYRNGTNAELYYRRYLAPLKKDMAVLIQEEGLPAEFQLMQNYPNPFNPATTINVAIAEAGYYALKVYNALGQEVAELVNGQLERGNYSITFDASKLSSGLYIYSIRGSNVNVSKTMIVMK
jgi:hypothetical protein